MVVVLGKSIVNAFFASKIEMAPNKCYFGTERGHRTRNLVVYLIFEQNALNKQEIDDWFSRKRKDTDP